MKMRYIDPNMIGKAIEQVIDQMKHDNKFTEDTTFDELCGYAGTHIKINETHQPERLSEKTSAKEDAIV